MKQDEDLLEKIYATDAKINKKKAFALQQTGYKFEDEWTIKDICHDKWAYVVNEKGEDNMRRVESIIFEHEEKLEKLKELERAKLGNSHIEQYFKLYGVMNYKGDKDTYNSHKFFSQVLYDCEPTPNDFIGWNADVHTMYVSVSEGNGNGHYKKPGFVNLFNISIRKEVDDLIEAGITKSGVPTMRQCHGRYKNCHKIWKTKYTIEEWRKDLSDALDIFIKEVSKLYDKKKPILIDKYGYMFQEGKKYLTRIFYDNNACLQLQQMEIFAPGKYREAHGLGVGKIPKFTKETNYDHVLGELIEHYSSLMKLTEADKEFRF